MNKQPEQTSRTRQSLIDAFWDMALDKGMDKVTISAITKRAGLNRGTFYSYFSDMPDLVAQAEDDIIHDLQRQAWSAIADGALLNFDMVSSMICSIFELHGDKFFLLIGQNGDPNFRAVVQSEATKVFREVLAPIRNTENGEYIMAYLTSAAIGALSYWHERGRKAELTELLGVIFGMATGGITGVMDISLEDISHEFDK